MPCYFRVRIVVLLGVVITDGKDEMSRFYAALPSLTAVNLEVDTRNSFCIPFLSRWSANPENKGRG
jgi:hypothetical protein